MNLLARCCVKSVAVLAFHFFMNTQIFMTQIFIFTLQCILIKLISSRTVLKI